MLLRDPRFLHAAPVVSVCASDDGASLYTLDERHTVRRWDRDGALLAEFAFPVRDRQVAYALRQHGEHLVCARGLDLHVLDRVTGEVRAVVPGAGYAEVEVGDEGIWVLSSSSLTHRAWDGAVRWSVAIVSNESALGLCRAPDGALWLRGEGDAVEARDAHSGALLRTVPAGGEWGARDVSPDGAWLAMDGGGDVLRVVHLGTGEVRTFHEPARQFGVRFLRWVSPGRLVAAFNNGVVSCWDLDGSTEEPRWRRDLPVYRFCPMTRVGDTLAVAVDLRLLSLDLATGAGDVEAPCAPVRGLSSHGNALYAFATVEGGTQQEQRAHRYDLTTGAHTGMLEGGHFFAPTPDGGLLSGAQVHSFKGDTRETVLATPPQGYWFNRVYRKALALPDGDTLAVLEGGNRGWVLLWSRARGAMIHAFRKHHLDLDVSADGRGLLLAPDKAECQWVDGATRKVTRTLPLPRRRPKAVRLSPDGGRAAVLDRGGAITVFDLGTGEVCWQLAKAALEGLAWSPDGAQLWTVGDALVCHDATNGAVVARRAMEGYAVLPLSDGRVAVGRAGYVEILDAT